MSYPLRLAQLTPCFGLLNRPESWLQVGFSNVITQLGGDERCGTAPVVRTILRVDQDPASYSGWPEREFVSVKARAAYAQPRKPFLEEGAAAPASLQHQHDDLLDFDDVSGKRHIETRLMRMVTVRQENAAAALEIMSRFAADPRWLIYLPPTMSPCETSRSPEYLEHPREAFEYFRTSRIGRVICEEKHMGSRAVAIVCRDPEVPRKRFGISGSPSQREGAGGWASSRDDAPTASDSLGIIYTRTGRAFFDNPRTEQALLARLRDAASAAGLWEELATDWLCLDCELMPWSAKAQALIREQYAAVAAAAKLSVSRAVTVLEQTAARLPDAAPLLHAHRTRAEQIDRYADSYRRYCWPVKALDDLKLAPFHLLASEGHIHTSRDHRWHMETLARLAPHNPTLIATPFREVDLSSQDSEAQATRWWLELVSRGGEGMVVKPLDFIARGPHGLVQPAVKVRGPEYLRIIYGPEYTSPPTSIASAPAASATSAPWPSASSPWASRPSNASCAVSPSAASTSASSPSSPWRASRSIRGSDPKKDRGDGAPVL